VRIKGIAVSLEIKKARRALKRQAAQKLSKPKKRSDHASALKLM
jgi:hypothetical protein